MQPAIMLLVFINDCKAFACLETPFLSHEPEHLCKRQKKPNSLPAVISQRQMFLFLPSVSSRFCSSITSNVRLKASSCFSPLFVPPPSATKDMDFSENIEVCRTQELNEAKMGISLRIKKPN